MESETDVLAPDVIGLMFHPDLFYGTPLAAKIKSLFNNKCYRQGGQSSDRFSLVMRELWGSITTEERAEICRRMADER